MRPRPVRDRRLSAAWLCLAVALAACGGPREPVPPEIDYGVTNCSACGMSLTDPRFAAALVFEQRDTMVFDDIGELAAWRASHPAEPVLAGFVHDYSSKAWIPAETAVFVKSAEIRSPMGFGVAAFADPARAGAFEHAATGQLLSYQELIHSYQESSHAN